MTNPILRRVDGLTPDQTHLSSKDFSSEDGEQFECLGETFTIAHPAFWARIEAGMIAEQYALFRWKVPLIDMDEDTHEVRRIMRLIGYASAAGTAK